MLQKVVLRQRASVLQDHYECTNCAALVSINACVKELGLVVLAGNAVGRDWLQASIPSKFHRLPAQWQVQVCCKRCMDCEKRGVNLV